MPLVRCAADKHDIDWDWDYGFCYECEREAEAEIEANLKAAGEVWAQHWPNHCKNCGGWGGYTHFGTYWQPPDFDPCESLDLDVCHRCGQQGMDEEASHPCTFCGWNFDDGNPYFGG